MKKFFGYGFVLMALAASGAGCSNSEIMSDDNQRLAHEISVMEWKNEQLQQRNQALKNQVEAFNRAVDASDMEFYSSRIPGQRTDAFQE